MQEMKYFNEGNDCDICKNQLMTGRDGTVEDCRRRQNGLSCRFEERDIRTCPVCEHEVDREDMYFTIGVRPCPVRWQPWQRVEVRFVVLECEQPCDEREHEHRGEPILSNYGAFNQKHTFFLHRRVLKYT